MHIERIPFQMSGETATGYGIKGCYFVPFFAGWIAHVVFDDKEAAFFAGPDEAAIIEAVQYAVFKRTMG